MRRERVKSSVIAAVAYDARDKVLEVEFHTGRVYHYHDVPRSAYDALRTADSIGKYFNEELRPHYRATEVRWTELDRYPDVPSRRR